MTPPVVLDASTALTFVLRDERDESTASLLASIRNTPAVVPAIWRPELLNGLISARRRRRIDDAGIQEALELLDCLQIDVDSNPPAFTTLYAVANANALSAYDACYLELAKRRQLRLATGDTDLIRAARQSGVALYSS